MSKFFKFAAVGVAAIVVAGWIISHANSLVPLDEAVKKQVGQVQVVMKRANELLPNLAETVRAYAGFEKETFEAVAKARAAAGGVTNIDPGKLAGDPAAMQKMQEASNQLGNVMSRLLMVQEKYPELKADKQFLNLQAELAGSVNRIAYERKKLQDTTNAFNVHMRVFPTNVAAMVLGYKQLEYFDAGDGAREVPKLDMSIRK